MVEGNFQHTQQHEEYATDNHSGNQFLLSTIYLYILDPKNQIQDDARDLYRQYKDQKMSYHCEGIYIRHTHIKHPYTQKIQDDHQKVGNLRNCGNGKYMLAPQCYTPPLV